MSRQTSRIQERTLRGALLCAAFLLLAGGGAQAQAPHNARASSSAAGPGRVADFAGTANPVSPGRCSEVLPNGMPSPFEPGSQTTLADYQIIGCWKGRLAGNGFTLAQYFSTKLGGGIAVQYAGKIVSHTGTGAGPPVVVRFTGESVCFAEKAGAYFLAVNLRRGGQMDDDAAQTVCPPPVWPPKYVLGLKGHEYAVAWPPMRH